MADASTARPRAVVQRELHVATVAVSGDVVANADGLLAIAKKLIAMSRVLRDRTVRRWEAHLPPGN